jgi:hypothetical protein
MERGSNEDHEIFVGSKLPQLTGGIGFGMDGVGMGGVGMDGVGMDGVGMLMPPILIGIIFALLLPNTGAWARASHSEICALTALSWSVRLLVRRLTRGGRRDAN